MQQRPFAEFAVWCLLFVSLFWRFGVAAACAWLGLFFLLDSRRWIRSSLTSLFTIPSRRRRRAREVPTPRPDWPRLPRWVAGVALVGTAPFVYVAADRSVTVARSEPVVRAQLEIPHPELPASWGRLRSIRGTGFDVVSVFWDIGGVNGNLVANRVAVFEHAEVRLVIQCWGYAPGDAWRGRKCLRLTYPAENTGSYLPVAPRAGDHQAPSFIYAIVRGP